MSKNVPEVRFKGFNKQWVSNKLSELAKFTKGKGYSKKDLIQIGTPIILYGRLYTKYETIITNVDTYVKPQNKSVISEGSEVIVPSSGESAEDISRASFVSKDGIILGGDLNVIKPNKYINPIFLALSLTYGNPKKELVKRAQGNTIVHLHNSDLKEVLLIYPNITEQQKIGDFFKQLDDTIALQQQLIEQQQQYKKAMLQKMFPRKDENSPRIRFGGFRGNWNKKKLKEVLTERKTFQLASDDCPLVSFTVEEGVTSKTNRYDRSFLVRDDSKKYKLTKFDDIVYNPANLKFGAISRNNFGTAVFSPIYVTFEVNSGYSPFFMECLVKLDNFLQDVLRFQEGTVYERMAVKPEDFLSMDVLIPSLDEQQKISSFFIKLDDTIAFHKKKLENYKQLKKALLQRMFV